MITANHFKELTNGFEKRSDGLWVHTGKAKITGALEVVGGPVTLPGGTAQVLLGEYIQPVTWSTPSLNVWHETPLVLNVTSGGGRLRMEYSVPFTNNTAGATTGIALGHSGSAVWGLGSIATQASWSATFSGTMYWAPSPGAWRFSVFLSTNLGQTTTNGGVYSTFYVTEQKI